MDLEQQEPLLFHHITGALMGPDPTVVDATVQPIYEPDMLLNE